MKNRLCEMLGIRYPIIQGGMAWSSDGTLAAAVSNAGGAGIIGSGGRTTEWVIEEIKKAKSLTDKPFGVNLMLMAPNVEEIAEAVCEEKVSFVTTGAGNPVPWIDKMHKAGVKVIPVVPNVKLAKRIAASGADAMVIEGMEGGGHIGKMTCMALLSNVLNEPCPIPVLAAGGISDGRAMAAALLMGADGVQMGTRFLLTTECPVHEKTKKMILNATDTDCVVTGFSRNMGVRCLENAFTRKYLAAEISGASNETLMELGTGTARMGMKEGDTENGSVMAGESLNVLNEILPCKDIIEKIIADANTALANAAGIFANGKEVTRRRSGAASRGSDEAIHKNDRQACRRINQRFLKQKKNRHSIQTVNIRMSDRFFTFIYFLSGPYLWPQENGQRIGAVPLAVRIHPSVRVHHSGSALFSLAVHVFVFWFPFSTEAADVRHPV